MINVKKTVMILLAITLCIGIIIGITPNEYSFFETDSIKDSNPFVTLDIGSTQTLSQGNTLSKGEYTAKVKLFGLLPIKTVRVSVLEKTELIPLGMPFGLKLYTDGVIVVDITDFVSDGKVQNPASAAGIREGDIIESYNGVKIKSNEQLIEQVNKFSGEPQLVKVRRNNLTFTASVTPVKDDSDKNYRIGLWVRDSTAGIGMLTFYDPAKNSLTGLGHSVSDSDTGQIMPVSTGVLVPAKINGVVKGQKGAPGELVGSFIDGETLGVLTKNEQSGLSAVCVTEQYESLKKYNIALKKSIKTGAAQIMCCVDGTNVETYNIKIVKINNNLSETKNMIIEITDERLLKKTGGIVKGMSGSPIIQNGKLVGAVTHVLVSDPTRGYAIFIENMLE